MRIEREELPIEGDNGVKACVSRIEIFRKEHPRTNKIRPDQVPFIEDFIILAKSKEGTRAKIMEAFDDLKTILLGGFREGRFLSLPQALAVVMGYIPFDDLELYRDPFRKILNKFY